MDAPLQSEPLSLAVSGARLAYDGRPLFDGLDVAIEGGLWTCVLGPSGVGKSALLRLILGLESENTEGGAETVACSDGRPLAGRAAYMAQRDLLLPWLTVAENVALAWAPGSAASRRIPPGRRRFSPTSASPARAICVRMRSRAACASAPPWHGR